MKGFGQGSLGRVRGTTALATCVVLAIVACGSGWRFVARAAAEGEPAETFAGLLFVKHGAVGTRSEGPIYYLQTATGDQVLKYHDREKWERDFELEFFHRRMVEVQGVLAREDAIYVRNIREICDARIPPRPKYGSLAEQAALAAKASAVVLAGPDDPAAAMKDPQQFRGLVFTRHKLIGTRSEGPDYFLQTRRGDYRLKYDERHSWERDDRLESYDHRIVHVEGLVTSPGHLQVKRIALLCDQRISGN